VPSPGVFAGIDGICWVAMVAALSALANIDAPMLAATSSE
jgi:hypothetical protein